MKARGRFPGRAARALSAFFFMVVFQAVQSGAAPFQLGDVNSTLMVDPLAQAGMFNWVVDGRPVAMQQQWFWFRVGPAGPERSVDVLPAAGPVLTDRNPFTDQRIDTFAIKYFGAQFTIELTASLQGGIWGSRQADITEQIKIQNTSLVDPLEFHFFQYADFDLGQAFIPNKQVPLFDDDLVKVKLDQVTGLPTEVIQWDPSARVTETIITPDAQLAEAALFNLTFLKLNNGVSDNLAGTLAAGPGDVTWAFQWDFILAPNTSVQISKDKMVIVPEPTACALFVSGLMVCAAAGRRAHRR
jgi:hypothetical protein